MNQPEGGKDPKDGNRPADGDAAAAAAAQQPRQSPPIAKPGQPVGNDGGAHAEKTKTNDRCQKYGRKILKWIRKMTPGDAALVAIAIIAAVIAVRQNTLIDKQNVLMVTANSINTSAAAAATSSAAAETLAVKLTQKGEAQAEATAKAIAETAKAGRDTATENAKTAKATEQVAITAERALGVANEANEHAAKAAKAAEDAVILTKKSVGLAANTTIHELRAYISVVGTDLRYDPDGANGPRMVATITMQNTGKTPAHNVDLHWDVTCLPRVNGIINVVPGGPPQVERTPTPRSVGPGSKFVYKKWWDLKGDKPEALNLTMDMWIWGGIKFKDAFTTADHFTDFNFTQGKQVGRTAQWEMIYADSGNEIDRHEDRLLQEVADPPLNKLPPIPDGPAKPPAIKIQPVRPRQLPQRDA